MSKRKKPRWKTNPNWREPDADGYETTCMYCALSLVAEELEAAMDRRDDPRALTLVHELTRRVEDLSEIVHAECAGAIDLEGGNGDS